MDKLKILKADIKLGYSCNNNCIHCVISDQKKRAARVYSREDRTTEEYKQELLFAKKKGVRYVVVTGGEPTIRKDIVEIVRFAHSIGLRMGMQTNGRMLSVKSFAVSLAPYNISYICALHGIDPETHDKITRSKGSFEQAIQGIKNLVELGQKVIGKTVISRYNQEQLSGIIKLLEELGVKEGNMAFPHAQGNAWDNFDLAVPSYTEVKPHIMKAIEYMKLKNVQGGGLVFDFEAVPPCIIDGKAKYCSDIREGQNPYHTELNQFDGKGARDWQELRQSIKKKFAVCGECCFDNVCEGVWHEYPEKKGDGEFKAVKDC